jgi:hypothetical protein
MTNQSLFRPLAAFTRVYISHARDYVKGDNKDFARDLFRFISSAQILPLLKASEAELFLDLDALQKDLDQLGRECHPLDVPDCSSVRAPLAGHCQKRDTRMPAIGAIEVRLRKDAEHRAAKYQQEHSGGVPLKKLVYAGRIRLRVVPGRSADDLITFVNENVAKGSTIADAT